MPRCIATLATVPRSETEFPSDEGQQPHIRAVRVSDLFVRAPGGGCLALIWGKG